MLQTVFKMMLTCFTGIFLFTGCKMKKKEGALLNGYDLMNPEKYYLPESMLEISGISFYKGNMDTLYAIQDEAGKLFRVPMNVKKQFNCKFWKGGDYEDLSIIHETVYVLKSDGSIYSFPFKESVYAFTDSTKEWKNLLPAGEYEGMYGDDAAGKLYVLCKNCPGDDAQKTVTGYILSINDLSAAPQQFQVRLDGHKFLEDKISRGFRLSAITKHPATGEWYILSAANRLLLIADSTWNIIQAASLPESTFNLPEGIAFDKSLNLYISNEGDDMNPAKILKFPQLIKK